MTTEQDHVLPSSRFRHRQLAHFMICHALPLALVVVLPFAISDLRFDATALMLGLGMWIATGGVGVSVGYHRHFAHRSFQAHPVLRHVMAFCGAMAGQGPVGYWVALHRRHHALSDSSGDPHSPGVRATGLSNPRHSFLQGHMVWAMRHDVPSPRRYALDLLADPVARSNASYYPLAVLTGMAIPALLGLAIYGGVSGFIMGLYWGGLVRQVVGHHLIWSINSVCHWAGGRDYATPDESRNVPVIALLTFGEGWHNNHHAFSTSARLGLRASQIDIGWYFIRAFRALGLVQGVREAAAK